MQNLRSYLHEFNNWQNCIRGKHLLLDTNFFIYCIQYEAQELLADLSSIVDTNGIQTVPSYIEPVLVELQNTNNQEERIRRNFLIDQCSAFPFDATILKSARELQSDLQEIDCYPAVTDLYLGATLKKYSNSTLLITGNLKDFPDPYFKRESYIILQDAKSVRTLSILSYDGFSFPQII